MKSAEVSELEWLEPWCALTGPQARERERQLAALLIPEHPLHGRNARALGAREDEAEETLFALEGPDELCVVNLSATRKRSADSPHFTAFESLEDFRQGCMLPDHLEATDEDVD
jgi:hypothetical protein